MGRIACENVTSPFQEIGIQKYTSVLGTFAAMYLTVKYHMRPVHEINLSPLYSSGVSSWALMLSIIPTICFDFQCHKVCITVYSSIENRKLSHWVFISVVSMFICLIIYSLTGLRLIFVVQSESISFTMRYLLITWGMITLFCGTYIFGESTSIAIMQLISDI
ncbi:hypothetical protein cypCar_00012944 [Cyprinus carpio]|nr:hypothetical protein cypCar_00012944 [Cyprinus carpio]